MALLRVKLGGMRWRDSLALADTAGNRSARWMRYCA